MSSLHRLLVVAAVLMLFAGCTEDRVTEPGTEFHAGGFDAELAALEIMALSGWEIDPDVELSDRAAGSDGKCLGLIIDWSRQALVGEIVHYSFLVQVGPGMHDRIMVHRVVKEHRPFRPIRTRHSIFLQHGDAVGFVKFLYGWYAPSVPDDHAVAIYLAQNDVDVWGIDQNWVLVPEETSDFGFMQDWGMDNQIENLNSALAIARTTRLLGGNGFRKMHLLGYSSGGVSGYAYINSEAVIPQGLRHVKGYVCADVAFKFAPEDEEYRDFICQDVAYMKDMLDAGEYAYWIPFKTMGELAAFDPDGESPLFPGWTNLKAVLVYGGATFQLWPFNSWWHYWGACFDEDGMPTAFNFCSADNVTDFMRLGCGWEAMRFMYDWERILCDDEEVPWDDNIAFVTVPILYLEPAGGIGSTGRYSLDLFGSTDVQIVTASMGLELTEDFGHIDMFTATQATHLVWQPLLGWILEHHAN